MLVHASLVTQCGQLHQSLDALTAFLGFRTVTNSSTTCRQHVGSLDLWYKHNTILYIGIRRFTYNPYYSDNSSPLFPKYPLMALHQRPAAESRKDWRHCCLHKVSSTVWRPLQRVGRWKPHFQDFRLRLIWDIDGSLHCLRPFIQFTTSQPYTKTSKQPTLLTLTEPVSQYSRIDRWCKTILYIKLLPPG